MARSQPIRAVLRDYLSLPKPRVVTLHLITAASAMFLAAHGQPPGFTVLCTLAGGGLVAGASNALNCYFDRNLDATMVRTRDRPLAAGRLKPYQALLFGAALGLAGLAILSQYVSLVVAALAAGAMANYLLVYTLWLKRRTYWSAIIGSAAGAVPPLAGWIAVTGGFELTPVLLCLIVSLWTLPHFWALAVSRRRDYELAGIGVLPPKYAARWIFVCSSLLVPVTLLLKPAADLSLLYLGAALLLGLGLFILAARLQHRDNAHAAQHLYRYSILYAILLFGAMAADRIASFR